MEGSGLLWGPTDRDLAGALDAAGLRQRAIAHNIANAETPNYRRFDVVYEQALQAEQERSHRPTTRLRRTHPSHLAPPEAAPVKPQLLRDTATVVRNDRSNVDVDREMAALAKNSLWYRTVTRAVGARFLALRTAITEGRR